MILEERVPLSQFTTFRLGGEARYFLRVHTQADLEEALLFAGRRALRICMLGGGSNTLFSDNGFDGLVIKLEMRGVVKEGNMLIAAAGEDWDALVVRAVDEGLWGIENLSGIPGSVGAAPVQNIGAYGAEIKDVLEWVEAYDTLLGVVQRFSQDACGFSYRTSRFKREPGRFCVLRVALLLRSDGKPNATYKDLIGFEAVSLRAMRERVLEIRAGKFPDLSREGTAGSFFLNPIVSSAQAKQLSARFPDMPRFDTEDGVKLSTAWLLDNALHLKGFSEGGARLFERQPLVIVANFGARAADVESLASKVRDAALRELSLELEPEVRIMH